MQNAHFEIIKFRQIDKKNFFLLVLQQIVIVPSSSPTIKHWAFFINCMFYNLRGCPPIQKNKQTNKKLVFRPRRQLLKTFFWDLVFLHYWSTDHLSNLMICVNELYGMVVPTYFDHPVIKEYILKYNQQM